VHAQAIHEYRSTAHVPSPECRVTLG
jgi:hypothetical protein